MKFRVTMKDPDTYMDGYRWLWDAFRSAAMDAFYDDENPVLVNVEPIEKERTE